MFIFAHVSGNLRQTERLFFVVESFIASSFLIVCLFSLFDWFIFLSRGSFLLVSRFLAPMGWRVRRTSLQPSAMIITFDLLIN